MKNSNLTANTLQLLKAFIASHAVFNALTYVQHQIADDEKRAALKALSTFANFIRKTADDVELTCRSKDKEWEMLKLYCQLEQWRFSDRLSFEFGTITNSNTAVPTFIYVPFIEQIVLFGLMSETEQIHIQILELNELGIKIECNFELDKSQSTKFNAEQTNRKDLLNERVSILSQEYNIKTMIAEKSATLTIQPN